MQNAGEAIAPAEEADFDENLQLSPDERATSCSVLGMRVDEFDYDGAVAKLRAWCDGGSRYVCCSTVHMVMESYDSAGFQRYVNSADMVVSDGVPIVFVTRKLGLDRQVRVDAPTLTLKLCEMAAKAGIPIGFYGSSQVVIDDLVKAVKNRFPALNVAYSCSPPFRPLTKEEDEKIVADIASSGVRLLFVGLGCPKQEKWMFEHRGRVPATMLGVGWTFDVLSGHSQMAPRWIQDIAMEWLYRLVRNPRKLWRRHLIHNPRFVVLAALQLMGLRQFPLGSGSARTA
jgi:N-acetylglucosaminyldiphosphoundecaprenol N-acetyl-beta-D-mannosaminyltransferase